MHMTPQEAKELQQTLQKHNPFVRISESLARKAEQAHRLLQKEQTREDFTKVEEALF